MEDEMNIRELSQEELDEVAGGAGAVVIGTVAGAI